MSFFIIAILIILVFYFYNRANNDSNSHKSFNHTKQTMYREKSHWETYKENNANKAQEIETLLGIDFSTLDDKNAREKIETIERLSRNMNCPISQIKKRYLEEIKKYPAHFIPQIIEKTKGEKSKEVKRYLISGSNTASSLMVEWLEELQQNILEKESYWTKWKRQNPEKATILIALTKRDLNNMADEDAKQIIESFQRMADAKDISDWSQIKDYFLKMFEEMSKDLCEEEIINVLNALIAKEADYAKTDFSNTSFYYAKQWYIEFTKSKNAEPLTPEENFRKEYRGKLIKKIGTNANIPLFCEGYDSPIAHEIIYLMYQHLRNGELKNEYEKKGLWNKCIQIIVEETKRVTERYCHASLQECIEYYNFPDKEVVTRDRCPKCGSRQVFYDFEYGMKCTDCNHIWNAPSGINLYL